MKIEFEKIIERDIDLLIINKFINEKRFKDYFLSIIGLSNYEIVTIEHSFMDNNGESDITVILENNYERIALLIEDKIDAVAMPNQYERYNIRGNKGIQNNEYDRFFVFIVAPEDYLNVNEEAEKYDNKISYEELLNILSYDLYATSIITQALEEKKKGYMDV